jgi:hypothetical protein
MQPINEGSRDARGISVILLLALSIRLLISWFSYGTNDITTWHDFGRAIYTDGLSEAYRSLPKLNHPPIPAYWSAIAYSLTRDHDSFFPFVFRIPAILADVGSCLILALIWQRRSTSRPWLAALAMALNLDAILISAFHGNTDNVYAFLSLLAVYLLCDLRMPFLSGLALAAAINNKLIPLVLIFPMLALCGNWREAIRFSVGLSFGALPFIIALIATGPALYHNVLSYTSDPNRWGIIWIARGLKHVPGMRGIGNTFVDRYHVWGRFVVLAICILLALFGRARKWNGYQLAATTMVAMLVFAPGFAVQYTVALAPLLLAVSLRWGSVYGALAGLFVLITYILYGTHLWPPRSQFEGLIPYKAAAVGAIVWLLLAWMLVRAIYDAMIARKHDPPRHHP